jgi:hypothetical protein
MKKKKKSNDPDFSKEWNWSLGNEKAQEKYKLPPLPLPKGCKVWTREEIEKAIGTLPEMASVMYQARTRAIEQVIVKIVERIEGGRPSNEDAEIFGRRNIYPDGLEIWCWRGIPIITVETLEHFVLKITELEYAQ